LTLLLLEQGKPHLPWHRDAGLLDGRWQLSIPGRSAGRARSADATRKRFLSVLQKLLTGSVE
jgi:hypothetical protein